MEDEHLAHHGIMGMKWGVRKERDGSPRKTLRSRVGDSIKRFGTVTSQTVNSAKSAYASMQKVKIAKRQKKVANKMAKDYAKAQKKMDKELLSHDTRKQREVALTTHDPVVLKKYMHLLTDDELKSRYDRIDMENKITNLAVKKSDRSYEVFKKRADWAMNSPVGKAAIALGSEYVRKRAGLNQYATERIKNAASSASNKAASQSKNQGRARKVQGMKWRKETKREPINVDATVSSVDDYTPLGLPGASTKKKKRE